MQELLRVQNFKKTTLSNFKRIFYFHYMWKKWLFLHMYCIVRNTDGKTWVWRQNKVSKRVIFKKWLYNCYHFGRAFQFLSVSSFMPSNFLGIWWMAWPSQTRIPWHVGEIIPRWGDDLITHKSQAYQLSKTTVVWSYSPHNIPKPQVF